MNKTQSMEKCPITDLNLKKIDATSYSINYNGEDLFIQHGLRFDLLISNKLFNEHKYIIAGAILNKQMPAQRSTGIYWFEITLDNLEELLNEIVFPKTPEEKLENLFYSLFHRQEYEGEKIDSLEFATKSSFAYKHFFKSPEECNFYFENLDYLGLIDVTFNDQLGIPVIYNITLKGLEYYLEITESGKSSNKCFVAMSFGDSMKEIRSAIKSFLNETNYNPIIIDEEHIDSDKTINDAIIAGIKRAKFLIADFTEQKHGVYFEAGFAIGIGIPVIYCCHKDDFDQSHFDTKHFAHIIYESPKELKNKLIDKINAWI